MYIDHFHLSTMPFQLTPDSHFFFESREHRRAIAHLLYGLSQEEGFIIITGEIGAGKTMLVEHLWSQLDTNDFVGARIATTQVTGDDLLKLVAHGFGLEFAAADKATMLRRLQTFFEDVQSASKKCLLVIDEVQNLPMSALEELRMLSNLTVSGRAPFQCLLLGQPQFRQTLVDPRLEQVQQRVLASCHLGPLSSSETREYIEHRLRTAGWTGDPSFEDEAHSAIHRTAEGIPRRINILCSRLLLAAYLDDTHDITEGMVREVAGELRRDLMAGHERPTTKPSTANGEIPHTLDARLVSIEQSIAKHDRAIKRALEITAQILEIRT